MSLREYLGDIDTFTASYEFEKMVTVRRKNLTVRTNWKSYIENSLENFHLPTVHQKTIGGMKAQWNPIDGAPGNYVILQSLTTSSRATLGEPPHSTHRHLARACRRRRAIHPDLSLQRYRSRPRLHVVQADGARRPAYGAILRRFLLSKSLGRTAGFEQIVPNYHKRFDLVISEDNGIAEVQLQGLSNPFSRSGRFSAWSPWCTRSTTGSSTAVIGPQSMPQRTAAE